MLSYLYTRKKLKLYFIEFGLIKIKVYIILYYIKIN